MVLTLETAKQLSERKWEVMSNQDGNDYNIEELVPELEGMINECAMCEFIMVQSEKECKDCRYESHVCWGVYADYVNNKCASTSKRVLEAIKEENAKI